jgi:hypothetical protein
MPQVLFLHKTRLLKIGLDTFSPITNMTGQVPSKTCIYALLTIINNRENKFYRFDKTPSLNLLVCSARANKLSQSSKSD